MKVDNFSQTAIKAACYRAYHWICDHPKIFDDCLAWQLAGEEEYASFKEQNIAGFKAAAPEFAASFPNNEAILAFIMQAMAAPALTLSRARYAENRLELALKAGVQQYVILGAGLDTFAWRQSDMPGKLQVFEVDHPSTQTFKQNRLAELGWHQPQQLHFIPADFATDQLATILQNSAYDPDKPSFFSWLGVTYYLPREAVFSTLKDIAGFASPGSQIVFDYLDSMAFIPDKAAERVKMMLMMAQGVGETMNMGFIPESIAEELNGIGFKVVEHLHPSDIQKRYFHNRNDNYHACEQAHLVSAMVGTNVHPIHQHS